MAASGKIRAGIGGWTFEPWRGVFYPPGLKQADELAYAASHLTTIEINATHYRLQTPASFRKWAAATPEGFGVGVWFTLSTTVTAVGTRCCSSLRPSCCSTASKTVMASDPASASATRGVKWMSKSQ